MRCPRCYLEGSGRCLSCLLEAFNAACAGLVMALIFLLALMSGCGSAPRIIEKPVPVPVVTRCLKTPAPEWIPVPAPVVCAKARLCYATSDGINLVDDIDAIRSWVREAMALCMPIPETK